MDFNQAVITTKFVLESNSKIVYVVHSKSGWQFYGHEKQIIEEDARVTSLGRIISTNSHVEDILWIPEGVEAWINPPNTQWQTGVAEPD